MLYIQETGVTKSLNSVPFIGSGNLKTDRHHPKYIFGWGCQNFQLVTAH